MHRPLRIDPRLGYGLALGAGVVAGHALLLLLITQAPREKAARSAAIEVRHLPAAAKQAAPAPVRPVAQAPQRAAPAARPPKPQAVRAEPAPTVRDLPAEAPRSPMRPGPPRVPPSTDLVFALQRGTQLGEARLSWRTDGARYALSLHAMLPSGRDLEQHSEGGFDAAGLAPLRLADRRHGRDVRAANFQREHGKVTFSGPRWELPLEPGTQDRLSWLVQLVAWIGGAEHSLREGSELALWVVGARGAASLWRFEVQGLERVRLDAREIDAWWLVREPAHPYDQRVEVWLDAQQGHWPLKLRQTQIPGGEPLEWLLRGQAPIGPALELPVIDGARP